MDFSIPLTLPAYMQEQLHSLIQDYKDENLTVKGYITKRQQLLDHFENNQAGLAQVGRPPLAQKATAQSLNVDRQSLLSAASEDVTSMLETKSRHQASVYRVTTVNSGSAFNSPKHRKSPSLQLSLQSTLGTKDSYNPMMPLAPRSNSVHSTDFLPVILRGRFEHYEKERAIISINGKGKEISVTWGRLYLRAEKVAHELNKSGLYKMSKILLWYNREEVIEFAVSLLGCFIAGMVAVPVSFEIYSIVEIIEIIKQTNSKFVLISSDCHKQLDNLQTTSNHTKIKLIKNDFFSQINFLKTDDLGNYSKAKKLPPTFEIPTVSYIEFTRTPLGRLSGVVMKHKILSNQFDKLAIILNSRSMPYWKKSDIRRPFHKKVSSLPFTVLNALDSTRSTGLILGLLFNIFSGNLLICIDDKLLTKAGAYENIIDRFRADILLIDQLQLKQVVINYLENPKLLSSKGHKVNFSCIKCCLTTCTTIDTEVTDMVVQKWLTNLGCEGAAMCYSPLLTLLDIGGVFISLKDQLGNLQGFPVHSSKLRLQDEIFIDKEKLRSNVIEPSVTAMINSSSSFKDFLRLSTFGFPIPDATLCVVNLDDRTLVPDLTVGEIWLSSKSVTDEFYQMDRVNNFIFNAKLNYQKMFSFVPDGDTSTNERLKMIANICPPNMTFLRTKLMGFIHNGKIYVLSMIEDMLLQNQLIRLPNWSHTSNISKAKKDKNEKNLIISPNKKEMHIEELLERNSPKRVVQTYYLQQVTETVVRTVNTVSDLSAFELSNCQEEHFMVMAVESILARNSCMPTDTAVVLSRTERLSREKKLNDLTEQIYRILWVFHKIQPMCILVVPKGSLPRRYCSLELANSTIKRKFLNGELDARFVKFQVDHIILDFVPHSMYYNESIFSRRLSSLRQAALNEESKSVTQPLIQTSGIRYKESSIDSRSGTELSKFANIMEVLEWRLDNYQNEMAFSDGSRKLTSSSSNDNNIHTNISWSSFEKIVAAYLRKILYSKNPLKRDNSVIIMCDNSVDYVAIVIACLYCRLRIIPLPVISEPNAENDIFTFSTIVKAYDVKRIFVDAKTHYLLENNNIISKLWKRAKQSFPKITVISRVKARSEQNIKMYKKLIQKNFGFKTRSALTNYPCIVWIDSAYDAKKNIHVSMSHSALMNSCKMINESFMLSNENVIFSLYSYTHGLGFLMSCFLGIFTGCSTNLYNLTDVAADPTAFLIGLQNQNVRDLYVNAPIFNMLMEKATKIMKPGSHSSKKDSKTTVSLRSDFLRNLRNLIIPFSSRPQFHMIESLVKRFEIERIQISYLYQHHFNFMISSRSYLGILPVDLYLDLSSLREGIIKEVNPSTSADGTYIRVQDSGVVPYCTDVTIVNPETHVPCYDGEFGEIWCCSEANATDYYLCTNTNGKPKLSKEPFITKQFKSKIDSRYDDGLSYLRTGDLGFIKSITTTDSSGNILTANLLFVLGSINETIDILGLTHFVCDLERSAREVLPNIGSCIVAKTGGLLVCLVKCKDYKNAKFANMASLIVTKLLTFHGVVLDLCAFVKVAEGKRSPLPEKWSDNRATVMDLWLNQKLEIEPQYGVNYGENISIYLLSEFENGQ